MADITKTTNKLSILTSYSDGDTRTITLDNPKASIAASEIDSLNAFIADNNLLIGDKSGANFTAITEARIIETTTKYLDLA